MSVPTDHPLARKAITALRAGAHPQIKGKLRGLTPIKDADLAVTDWTYGFCAEGVVCDVSGLGSWGDVPDRSEYSYYYEDIPDETDDSGVMRDGGMIGGLSPVYKALRNEQSEIVCAQAVNINDFWDADFDLIADVWEELLINPELSNTIAKAGDSVRIKNLDMEKRAMELRSILLEAIVQRTKQPVLS